MLAGALGHPKTLLLVRIGIAHPGTTAAQRSQAAGMHTSYGDFRIHLHCFAASETAGNASKPQEAALIA
jgi:hypothetical protein